MEELEEITPPEEFEEEAQEDGEEENNEAPENGEEEIDKNVRLFMFLYGRFIKNANNDLETMDRFAEKINSIFEENGSDIKIIIKNEEEIRANSEEYEDEGVELGITGEHEYVSDDLLISLNNFLFNIPRDKL